MKDAHADKDYKPRLLVAYRGTIIPSMQKEFNYKNMLQVPRLEKISINMGVGIAKDDIKYLDQAVKDLETIAGQKPVITRAKKAISNFKIKRGQAIGCRVTLRGSRMYEFTDRLISLAIPRIKDFKGLSRESFDGHGNFTLGLTEQLVFPEIDYDKVQKIMGMDITFVTTAKNDKEALRLLQLLGIPFK